MGRITKEKSADKAPAGKAGATPFDLDSLIRFRLREAIEEILVDELETALGAGRHERNWERQGYRNGTRERTLTCQAGTTTLAVPRGRLFTDDDATGEFRSRFLPYYQRRTEAVNATMLGAYVSGASTRKVQRALAPLWRKGPLSKSAVSRLAPRLKARWETFQERGTLGPDLGVPVPGRPGPAGASGEEGGVGARAGGHRRGHAGTQGAAVVVAEVERERGGLG